jgi:hypothetical protein
MKCFQTMKIKHRGKSVTEKEAQLKSLKHTENQLLPKLFTSTKQQVKTPMIIRFTQ